MDNFMDWCVLTEKYYNETYEIAYIEQISKNEVFIGKLFFSCEFL